MQTATQAATQIADGLCQMLLSVGALLVLYAVYPAAGELPGVQIERAPDLSNIKVEIRVARPWMMKGGIVPLCIGLAGISVLTLMRML
jgi:hypothetical protein